MMYTHTNVQRQAKCWEEAFDGNAFSPSSKRYALERSLILRRHWQQLYLISVAHQLNVESPFCFLLCTCVCTYMGGVSR